MSLTCPNCKIVPATPIKASIPGYTVQFCEACTQAHQIAEELVTEKARCADLIQSFNNTSELFAAAVLGKAAAEQERDALRDALENCVAAAGSYRSDLLKLHWDGIGERPADWSEPDGDRDKHLREAKRMLAKERS